MQVPLAASTSTVWTPTPPASKKVRSRITLCTAPRLQRKDVPHTFGLRAKNKYHRKRPIRGCFRYARSSGRTRQIIDAAASLLPCLGFRFSYIEGVTRTLVRNAQSGRRSRRTDFVTSSGSRSSGRSDEEGFGVLVLVLFFRAEGAGREIVGRGQGGSTRRFLVWMALERGTRGQLDRRLPPTYRLILFEPTRCGVCVCVFHSPTLLPGLVLLYGLFRPLRRLFLSSFTAILATRQLPLSKTSTAAATVRRRRPPR